MSLPRIYCFINSGQGTKFVITAALAEDGHFVGGHNSSSDDWAKQDILGEWKHEEYRKHFPQGFELVWIEGNPKHHPEVMAAYEKHLALPKEDADVSK